MRRIFLALALMLAPAAANAVDDTCHFTGSGNWSSATAYSGTKTCTGGGGTLDANDLVIIDSGVTTTITGSITQGGGAGIGVQVASGGALTVGAVTVTLGSDGLNCAEGSTCTMTGTFKEFGNASPTPQSDFSRSAFFTVGDIVDGTYVSANTATISYPTTNANGQDYDSADGGDGDTNLSESLGAITTRDVLCFFDPDPADEYVPADVNACYKVTAVDANPAGGMSLSVDVRQGAVNSTFTLARRDAIVGTLAAPVIRGQTTITLGAQFADAAAAADAVGRWIRFENVTSGSMLGRAYRILSATDNGSSDTVTLVDLRGVEEAHASGDSWTIELQGWNVGDPFYVEEPAIIKLAAAPATTSKVYLNGTVSLRAVVFDTVPAVYVGSTSGGAAVATTTVSEFRDVWIIDPDNGLSASLIWNAPSLTTLERLSITGNSVSNNTHGFVTYSPVIVEDSLVRFSGDDCYGTVAATSLTVTRARCEFKNEDDAGDSTNLIETNSGLSSTVRVNGASVVRGSTTGGAGGVLSCAGSGATCVLSEVTAIGGGAFVDDGGFGSRITSSNVALYGGVSSTSSTSSIFLSGNLDHFVARSFSLAYGFIAGGASTIQRNGLILDGISTETGGLIGVKASAGATLDNVAFVNVNHSDAAAGLLKWSNVPSAAVRLAHLSLIWNPRIAVPGWANAIQSTGGTWSGTNLITFDSILVSGFHDFAGTRVQSALRGNQKEFWSDNTWVGTQCFFGNETDFTLVSGTVQPTPFTEVRDSALGLNSSVHVQTGSGSVVAGLAGCGILGGSRAPGLSRLTWGQRVNRLPIERASDASMSSSGGWLPRSY